MSAIHLTAENFQTSIESNAVAAIDFWASWCGPCKMLAPTIDALADDYAGKALVGKIDVDAAGALAQKYNVMTIPTVILFKDGQEVDRKIGVLPQNILAAAIDSQL